MKSVLFFIYVVLFSTTIHAKVEVLCLGEGECITLDNAVHPGSLSGASTDQKLKYFDWYQDQSNSPLTNTDEDIINDIKTGDGTQDDLKQLNEYINDINNKIDKESDFEVAADGKGLSEDEIDQEYGDDEDGGADGESDDGDGADGESDDGGGADDQDDPSYDSDKNPACVADPQFYPTCPGYDSEVAAVAAFNAACVADPHSDSKCPEYDAEVAAFNADCVADPQSDSKCPGYTKEVTNGCQIGADGLWKSRTEQAEVDGVTISTQEKIVSNVGHTKRETLPTESACLPACEGTLSYTRKDGKTVELEGSNRNLVAHRCYARCGCIKLGLLEKLCAEDPSRDNRCPGHYKAKFG